jgi:hypothetical protein
MNRNTIRRNITLVSVFLYLGLFITVVSFRPTFLYNDDGSLREFGIGFRNKTVLPGWFLAIALAVLSYFSVLYYLAAPRLKHF